MLMASDAFFVVVSGRGGGGGGVGLGVGGWDLRVVVCVVLGGFGV